MGSAQKPRATVEHDPGLRAYVVKSEDRTFTGPDGKGWKTKGLAVQEAAKSGFSVR